MSHHRQLLRNSIFHLQVTDVLAQVLKAQSAGTESGAGVASMTSFYPTRVPSLPDRLADGDVVKELTSRLSCAFSNALSFVCICWGSSYMEYACYIIQHTGQGNVC